NSGAYSGAIPGNATYTVGIGDNGGVAPARAARSIVGQGGGRTITTTYPEGTAPPPPLTTSGGRGDERKPGHAAIAFQDTDDNATDFILVSPTGPASLGLTSSPSSLDFGSVNIGDTATQSVTVKNNFVFPAAAASVTIAAPALGGADA